MTETVELVPLTKDALLGAWRMTSWTYEIVGSGEKRDALGPDPRGWIVYTPEEKLALYDTMFAYSGTYTVKSDRVIHHLDMSWNEAWTGTEQVRFCKIEGGILTYTSAPAKNPLDGSEVVHTVKFERAT